MSENQQINAVPGEPQATTSDPPQANTTGPVEQNSNKTNVISIATKEINDVIQFQEPSTSKNYSFKTEIRINILGEPKASQKSLDTADSVALSLYEEHGDPSRGKKGNIEPEESYSTVDACIKEKTTNTNDVTHFSRNDRTQRMIVVNSDAPPPYENQPPPAYSRAPYYSPPAHQTYIQPVTDASRGDRYYRTDYDQPYADEFMFQEIRHDFIRKVFFILSIQLLITTGFILLVMFHKPSRNFVAVNMPMFWIMVVMEMVLYITLICYKSVRRIFPLNFILLLLFTIAMSYICAFTTIFYSTKVILLTAGSTALICLVVSVLAYQKWFDITQWSFIIAIASIIVMVFGFIVIIVSFVTYSPVLWLVYAGIVTALFTVFLLYDMQCILGGRREEISPEEYIFGALTLYVDIIMIFLYMLQLVQACST